jgi:hypothetical protein
MKHGWPYSLLNAVAILLLLGGAFSLLSHLAGQFQQGSASELSLFGGAGAVILGIVFLALADFGTRLVRIETKLGTLPKDEFAESEQPRSNPGPAQEGQSAQVGKPDTRFHA